MRSSTEPEERFGLLESGIATPKDRCLVLRRSHDKEIQRIVVPGITTEFNRNDPNGAEE